MAVGVLKKKVKVLTAGSEYSTSDPVDVYVINTSDPDLLLSTSSDTGSASDLTGNATIGSDVDAQVSIGTGGGADTIIGSKLSGNSTTIRSTDINIGTDAGSHNIYIGAGVTGTSDSIFIGSSTKSEITIGNNNAGTNSLYVNSRNVTLGSRSGSTHSTTIVQGDTVTARTTGEFTINSDSNVAVSSTNIDISTTSATIRNEAEASAVSKIVIDKTVAGGMIQTHRGSTTISSSSRTSGIEYPAAKLTVSADAGGKNISLNSNNGILLRASDLQLTSPLANTSGYYINLTEPESEFKYVNASNDTVARVAVSSSGVTIGNYSSGVDTNFIRANTTSGTLEINFSGAILSQNTAGITISGTDGSTVAGFSNGAYSNKFFSITGFHAVNGGYTPFTGIHIFDIQPDSNIAVGDAVIAVNRTAMLTTTPNDKRCIGIVCEILENNKVHVASVGDNDCGELKGFKVCNENGPISAGDLLTTSSTAGYLMKQSDDIMRSSTVGKSAVDVVFDNTNKAVDIYGFIYCG